MAKHGGEEAGSAFDSIMRDSRRARMGKRLSADKRPHQDFLIQIGIGPIEDEEEDDDDTEE